MPVDPGETIKVGGGAWPNGKALAFGARDWRFDPSRPKKERGKEVTGEGDDEVGGERRAGGRRDRERRDRERRERRAGARREQGREESEERRTCGGGSDGGLMVSGVERGRFKDCFRTVFPHDYSRNSNVKNIRT